MKTKIFLLVLSILMLCTFSAYAKPVNVDEDKSTILTDRFLIDAFNATPVTVGRIKLTAKHRGVSQNEQFQQFEKKSGSSDYYNYIRGGFGNYYGPDSEYESPKKSKKTSSNESVQEKLRRLQDLSRSSDGQIQKDFRKNDDDDQRKESERPRKKEDEHFTLWPFYAIGDNLLLSVSTPNNSFSYYYSRHDLENYNLFFSVSIGTAYYPVKIIALHKNFILWKIQKKLKTKLSPLALIQSHGIETGQIISIMATDKYGRLKITAGNINRVGKNGNEFWLSSWSGSSLPELYIIKNLKGQIIGLSGGEDSYGYSHTVQITKKQIESLLLSSKKPGKSVTGNAIGLVIMPFTNDLAYRLGVHRTGKKYIGKRLIVRHYPSNKLQRIGFNKGDLIYSINGVQINNLDSMKKELNKIKPGDWVSVTVLAYNRDHKQKRILKVKVRKRTVIDILLHFF